MPRKNPIKGKDLETAKKLRELRKRLGWTTAAFGELICFSGTAVVSRERAYGLQGVRWRRSEVESLRGAVRMRLIGLQDHAEEVFKELLGD